MQASAETLSVRVSSKLPISAQTSHSGGIAVVVVVVSTWACRQCTESLG